MRKSRLSPAKQARLMEHFVAGTTARCAAALVGVNRKTAAYYFHRLREIVCYHQELEADRAVGGEIEVDESYFGGRRKGKRGRGAAGKVPVFGLLKRGGRVYTKIIPDARSDTLIPIIKRKVVPATKCSIRRPCFARLNRLFLIPSLITPHGVIWDSPKINPFRY